MYAKVFSQMYDGTLCNKGPWQALVTFQQMLVLADQDGVVDMTAEAIARRTTIPLNIIEMGIAALMEPDAESRTPTEDGRRIVLLSPPRAWGWRVVNYRQYRQMNRSEDRREYYQNYWEKVTKPKRAAGVNVESTNQPIALALSEATYMRFALFWREYPKKKAKPDAERAWRKVKPEEVDAVMAGLRRDVQSPDWTKDGGKYIPYPGTWLNGRRWEDEGMDGGQADDARPYV